MHDLAGSDSEWQAGAGGGDAEEDEVFEYEMSEVEGDPEDVGDVWHGVDGPGMEVAMSSDERMADSGMEGPASAGGRGGALRGEMLLCAGGFLAPAEGARAEASAVRASVALRQSVAAAAASLRASCVVPLGGTAHGVLPGAGSTRASQHWGGSSLHGGVRGSVSWAHVSHASGAGS